MKILISLLFLFLLMGVMTPSNTVQPDSDATIGSGRQEQIMRDVNTSPNPLPVENESEKFRGSTIQKEEAAPVKTDDARKAPTYEHNGLYRKGL